MRRRDDLVFPMAEYDARLARLRAAMAERQLDAFIVTTPENLFYLTGYQTPGYYWFQALVVPLAGEPFIVTRRLEDSNVETRTWLAASHPYEDADNPPAALGQTIARYGLADARIGYERQSYFFRASEQDVLFATLPDATFLDASGMAEALRLIKSDAEIDLMRQAARCCEAGMQAGIETVAAGVDENQVAAEIQAAMTRAGSHYPAIHPFVASGWRGAVGHATWEDRVIEPGDAVFLEIGGCRHRYHAAMMRVAIVGEPPAAMLQAERVVQDAMQACLETIKPGVPAGQIDAVARAVVAAGAPDVAQVSRTGYSIGIGFAPDWGEGHILSLLAGEERPLEANMTFHLIPWVQVPGAAGVGLTETVRVTPSGCELLTQFERRMFVR